MPIFENAAIKFKRIWQFVNQKQAGDEVFRSDLDTAIDDVASGVNYAIDRANSAIDAAGFAFNTIQSAQSASIPASVDSIIIGDRLYNKVDSDPLNELSFKHVNGNWYDGVYIPTSGPIDLTIIQGGSNALQTGTPAGGGNLQTQDGVLVYDPFPEGLDRDGNALTAGFRTCGPGSAGFYTNAGFDASGDPIYRSINAKEYQFAAARFRATGNLQIITGHGVADAPLVDFIADGAPTDTAPGPHWTTMQNLHDALKNTAITGRGTDTLLSTNQHLATSFIWHQGEADSDAQALQANNPDYLRVSTGNDYVTRLEKHFRTLIDPDLDGDPTVNVGSNQPICAAGCKFYICELLIDGQTVNGFPTDDRNTDLRTMPSDTALALNESIYLVSAQGLSIPTTDGNSPGSPDNKTFNGSANAIIGSRIYAESLKPPQSTSISAALNQNIANAISASQQAINTANQASTTAANAQSTADGIASTAANAQTAAGQAQTAANNVGQNLNALAQQVQQDGVDVLKKGTGTLAGKILSNGMAILFDIANLIVKGGIGAEYLSVGLGGNLIKDPLFNQGLAYYFNTSTNPDFEMLIREPGLAFAGERYPTLALRQDGDDQSVSARLYGVDVNELGNKTSSAIAVEPGQYYMFSAKMAWTNCPGGKLRIFWREVDGTFIPNTQVNTPTIPNVSESSENPDTWPISHVLGQAPANAAFCNVVFEKDPTNPGQPNSFMFVYKPQLTLATADTKEPRPFDSGGSSLITGEGIVTRSITALSAVFAAGAIQRADIGDAQIDRLKVAGRSIIASDVAVTAGSVTISSTNLTTVVQDVSARETGFQAEVTFHLNGVSLNTITENNAFVFEIRRGSTVLQQFTVDLDDTNFTKRFPPINITVVDEATNVSGNQTYQLRISTSNFLRRLNVGRATVKIREFKNT